MAADPIAVLSYPKAGRTWLRTMIWQALHFEHGEPPDARMTADETVPGRGLPRLFFDHDGSALQARQPWRALETGREEYRGRRVLLLGRDVRDILVSSYFQATRRVRVFDGPIDAFIRDDRFGAEKVLAFYRIWEANRHVPAALHFVRYEDLHRDPERTLAQVMVFLGANVSPRSIANGVAAARFEAMRKAEVRSLERGDAPVSSRMGQATLGDPESYKVRRGVVGGYGRYLSAADIAYVDARVVERGCEFTRPSSD